MLSSPSHANGEPSRDGSRPRARMQHAGGRALVWGEARLVDAVGAGRTRQDRGGRRAQGGGGRESSQSAQFVRPCLLLTSTYPLLPPHPLVLSVQMARSTLAPHIGAKSQSAVRAKRQLYKGQSAHRELDPDQSQRADLSSYSPSHSLACSSLALQPSASSLDSPPPPPLPTARPARSSSTLGFTTYTSTSRPHLPPPTHPCPPTPPRPST